MKIKIELNAKCKNCKQWVFTSDNDFDFLNDDETYCKLDNSKRLDSDECDKLEIDFFSLEDNLKSAGYEKIVGFNL